MNVASHIFGSRSAWTFAWRLLRPGGWSLLGLLAGLAGLDTIVRLSVAVGGWSLPGHGLQGLLTVGAVGMLVIAVRTQVARVAGRQVSRAYYRSITSMLARADAVQGPSLGPTYEHQTHATAWKLKQLVTGQLPGVVGGLVTVTAASVWLAPRLSARHLLATVLTVTLVTPYVALLQRKIQQVQRDSIRAHQRLAAELGLLLRGHEQLTASEQVDEQAERAARQVDIASSLQSKVALLQSLTGRGPILVAGALATAALGLWSDLGSLSLDQTGTLLVAGSLLPASVALLRGFPAIVTTLAQVQELGKLTGNRLDPVSPETPAPVPWGETIRLNRVTFSYEGSDRPVLDELSLIWKPGEILCVTGPNGSGKSTLLRLVLRLADPEAGSIYVGPTDLRSLDVTAWRRGIAHLPQRTYLPERMTVGEVLDRLGRGVSRDVFIDALEQVRMHEKLSRLGRGDAMQARVQALSAGQRQRLSLAMLLAQEAHLLLLDEPDTSLDSEGLSLLIEKLKSLPKSARVLVIAHDPRLIACADRVIELQLEEVSTKNIEKQNFHLP